VRVVPARVPIPPSKKTHLNARGCTRIIMYTPTSVAVYDPVRRVEKTNNKMSKVSLKFLARIKTRYVPQGNDGVKIKSKIVFSVYSSHSSLCVPRYFDIKAYICRRKIKTTKRQGNTI